MVDGNDASARLLGRLGFRQGRVVDGAYVKGAWATTLVYALLEDEWRSEGADGA